MDAAEFAREIRKATTEEDRIAWFGALLRKEAGTDVEIVGGSAIEVYLSSGEYVTQDIDVVGNRLAIEAVLRRWGLRTEEGRDHRVYWAHPKIGLVDVVGLADRSGLAPRKVQTPYGFVKLSAPEPLIIRRLFRADRERSEELFRQAVALARIGDLDWGYLEAEARFEKVEPGLRRLRKLLRG